ncbi:MAG: prephenate dehydrogenase/arogenate dehydrogenase family protein [Oscillospiraceae bacterium]|nr:prephenate dehydrogenase/arogenate dehydrogenase family protein [Oscillospiraceae bacterium]
MRIGIIGLGLIGGSLAKTLRARTAHTLYGTDLNADTVREAVSTGVLDAPLGERELAQCDVIAVALFPGAIIEWLRENAARIAKNAVVFDCGGIKTAVCETCFALAAQHGFVFFGGHPMAGTERSGWAAARSGLFDNASMLLVRPAPGGALCEERIAAADSLLEKFFLSLGFGRVVHTTAAVHDSTIAYTSQLAHVVSSAYIKSPTARNYVGFSAGSFKDMTRVAFLNENMWTELFLDNAAPLVGEIDFLIERLAEYRDAIAAGDGARLKELLADGKQLKLLSDRAAKPD